MIKCVENCCAEYNVRHESFAARLTAGLGSHWHLSQTHIGRDGTYLYSEVGQVDDSYTVPCPDCLDR